jgi:Fis family transcriptional regulator
MTRAGSGQAYVAVDLCVDHARRREPLRDCVRDAVEHYFAQLGDHPAGGLYELVLREVEAPLLACVLRHARGNQSRAAQILGINRGTLRKKLLEYGIDDETE